MKDKNHIKAADNRILSLIEKQKQISQSDIVDWVMKSGDFTKRNGARVSVSRSIKRLKTQGLIKIIKEVSDRGIKKNLVCKT